MDSILQKKNCGASGEPRLLSAVCIESIRESKSQGGKTSSESATSVGP